MPKFTKTAIMQSFVKLLESTPFDKITVKDIVDDCGVNRNTFYYNFEDIYALVDELLSEEVARVLEKQRSCNSWKEGLYYGAEFVLQNKKAVYHLYHSTKKDQLERYFKRVVYDAAADVVRHEAEALNCTDADIEFVAGFYGDALIGLIRRWLDNDMKGDLEAMIRKLSALLDNNVHQAILTVSAVQ